MTSDIKTILRKQADHLRKLQENWDGYGAQPIADIALNAVLNDLDTESSNSCPCLIPGADGSVQAEWHVAGADIEYCVSADGTARSLSVKTNADELDHLKAQLVRAKEALRWYADSGKLGEFRIVDTDNDFVSDMSTWASRAAAVLAELEK